MADDGRCDRGRCAGAGIGREGETVEKGDWREYAPIAEGKVVVEVRDLAGKVVRAELETRE